MSDNGMEAFPDTFTDEDRAGMRDLAHREAPRTVEVVREVEDGTIVEGHEKREVFTFTEPSMGTFVFDVRSIKDGLAAGRIAARMFRLERTPEDFYQHVLANNGVVPERLAKTEADLARPGIMVDWGNGYQTMIDGNHRLCRRYQLGLGNFRFLLVSVLDCLPHMCRPGDEEKLFMGKQRPGVETLHTEIKTEE